MINQRNISQDFNDLVDAIAEKLPTLDVVGQKQSVITGTELMLCGHKTWNGEFIQPNKMYYIMVPIARAEIVRTTNNEQPPTIQYKHIDHKSKLVAKWKLNGLNGVYHYLRPYLNDAQMQQVKAMFMEVKQTA